MKLPRADWQRRAGMRELLAALGAAEGATRYVGGCVRDTLLELEAADIDLATRLGPQEVLKRLGAAKIKAVPTGIAHGTVTGIVSGRPVEITTLRRDVATDGRRATIAYTDDWREDAARRDFTINALSADPLTLEIHDYFGGGEDLAARRVRFIGDPLIRIAEDHLRILRFFRFHARFAEGEPDREAVEACAARANDLMALSRERIADELSKLLNLPRPEASLRLMVERGVLRPVLPEIDAAGATRLESLVARETDAGLAPDWLRRMAALLPRNPELAANIASRLRLSKRAAKRLVAAAGRSPSDANAPLALAYREGRDAAVDRILLGDGDPAPAATLQGWERPRLRLGGGNLIEMGLPHGPIVARTLQAIEREWIEAGFPADAGTQREMARRQVDQALRASQ